jgi:type II secretory pathway component PulK
MLITIVLLLVATCITMGIVRAMTHHHRQMRRRQRQLQAVWLAESGIERATAQLRLDPGYQGEKWDVPANQIAGDWAGVVEIQTTPLGGQPWRNTVSVVADYPPDPPYRIRYRKSVLVDLRAPGK